jgi:hypothetical protein
MKLERKELKDDWVLREIQDGEDWLQASNEGTLAVSTLPTQCVDAKTAKFLAFDRAQSAFDAIGA